MARITYTITVEVDADELDAYTAMHEDTLQRMFDEAHCMSPANSVRVLHSQKGSTCITSTRKSGD